MEINFNHGRRVTFKDILDPDRFPSMAKRWNPLMLHKKDRYLTPEELKKKVLNSVRINNLLNDLSNNDKTKREEMRTEVVSMLNEIGLESNMLVIRVLGQIISSFMQRIYDHVYVNEQQLNEIKRKSGSNPVLFLPSHRSYGDFIIMSYLCFTYDIEIPAIAAGMDFHGMIGMGAALRKTGAFFMRRKFSNDKLYWHVFKEYMHSLVTIFHRAVEFFLEGTRSRSYKALPPKIGLLSMTLEPLFMGEVSDITIVPINISYEKPLEEQLFVYELLGVPKPKESTLGLIKAFSIIEQKFGSMYFDFGKPVSAREFLGDKLNRFQHSIEPADVQILSKQELNHVNDLAHEIIHQQQKMNVLCTFHLFSYYFMYRNLINSRTDFDDVVEGICVLIDLFGNLGAGLSVKKDDIQNSLLTSINLHSNIIQLTENKTFELIHKKVNLEKTNLKKLKGHNLSETTMEISVPIFTLQLYINPCLSWVVLPAFTILVAKIITKNGNKAFDKDELRTRIHTAREIFSQEFVFYSTNEEKEVNNTINLLQKIAIFSTTDDNKIIFNNNNKITNLILSSVVPFVFAYYQITEIMLSHFSDKDFTEHQYAVKVQEMIEINLLSQKEYVHPYCLSLDSISLALFAFCNNQSVVKESKDSGSLYRINQSLLSETHSVIEQYCHQLPFKYVHEFEVDSKLKNISNSVQEQLEIVLFRIE